MEKIQYLVSETLWLLKWNLGTKNFQEFCSPENENFHPDFNKINKNLKEVIKITLEH